jgi:hypothetical protein
MIARAIGDGLSGPAALRAFQPEEARHPRGLVSIHDLSVELLFEGLAEIEQAAETPQIKFSRAGRRGPVCAGDNRRAAPETPSRDGPPILPRRLS